MKKLILIIAILCLSANCYAFDDWDRADYALLAGAGVMLIMDAAQTEYIADHPNQYHEVGMARLFIGEHPNNERVVLYFAGSAAVLVGVAYILPSKWRKLWLGGWIINEAGWVIRNNGLGVGMSF